MMSFEVKDMTCGHCVSTLTKALKAADKDARVRIDLATRRVQVEPVAADAEALARAMTQAGYTPVLVHEPAFALQAQPRGACCGHCR